jgi:hypothetical protein
VKYHLEALPPLCLLHDNAYKLPPFSQSVELAEERNGRGCRAIIRTLAAVCPA